MTVTPLGSPGQPAPSEPTLGAEIRGSAMLLGLLLAVIGVTVCLDLLIRLAGTA